MSEAINLNEGKSAYEIWLAQGNTGTEEDFLEAMRGNSGYQGAAGELEVVNNLNQGGAAKALSAEMGKKLNQDKADKDLENLSAAGKAKFDAKANTKGTYEELVAGDLVSLNDRVTVKDKFVIRSTAGDESIDSSRDALLLELIGGCGDTEAAAFKINAMRWNRANALDPSAWASGKTSGYITGAVVSTGSTTAIGSGSHKLCIIRCPKCEAGEYGTAAANNGYLLMGYGASFAYQAAKGATFDKPVIKTQAVLVTPENVKECKAMFITGTPEYDYDNLSFCVLADYATFADAEKK